ncbi:hypothetical protein K437DRAFT_296253 [Tilletiaria anomala UBC 951]|uniref:PLD phosphodiesterase domain-containing protein n=1 Tax=Tilletiaria anomala (strain ATCC 24038 / CBS 436.72 / UBC 951) TaxID=1037660 RepID=A0A066VAY2_TILAU|nr:uncharacterized protein K437DRAFT_296253 [Tilletiaria anomala UBC 951]KDN38877.1 hypothetical protein K437DRAFT_296253 [Tilletiaria anomala UBC 951]
MSPPGKKHQLRDQATRAGWCTSTRPPQNRAPSITSALACSLSTFDSKTGTELQTQTAQAHDDKPLQNDEASQAPGEQKLTNGGPLHGVESGSKAKSSQSSVLFSKSAAKSASTPASTSISLSAIQASKYLFPLPPSFVRGVLRVKIKHKLEEGRGSNWIWHKGAIHPGNLQPDDEELKSICARFGYRWSRGAEVEAEGGEKEAAAEANGATQTRGSQGADVQGEPAPSRLYLMMLADSLLPLPRNQMSGVVSPALLATTGIVPLSIFSTGPDIIGHYYDCIVAAKREVIIMTNYWQGGKNVNTIADALCELSRREALRKQKGISKTTREFGHQIVVKVMWDRGPRTLADLFRLRKAVPPNMWRENGLPTPQEIPHLHMEILNYHRPLMGTFHAKLLLVDRRVALVNSNNIQDRPNLEACVRLEGDIVNSIYDHALISWGNTMLPPLPCLTEPATAAPSSMAFAVTDASAVGNAADVSRKGAGAGVDAPPEEVQDVGGTFSVAAQCTNLQQGASALQVFPPPIVAPASSIHHLQPHGSSQRQDGVEGNSSGGQNDALRESVNDLDEGIERILAHLSASKAALRERARDARQRLKKDDEEAEDEKERLYGRRQSLGDVVDSVMMRRRSGVADGEGKEAHQPQSQQSYPQQQQQAHADAVADHGDQQESAAVPLPAEVQGLAHSKDGSSRENAEHLDEHQHQTARRAGALWAQKVLGERFKGFEGLNLSSLSQPRSPFGSFSFGHWHQAQQVHSNAQGHGSADAPLSPTSRRHFADIVEALMNKEGIRPPGWAEGALEVFGLGESSSRNVAFEARKARREAAQAKIKALNIPTSVVEEDGGALIPATTQQHTPTSSTSDGETTVNVCPAQAKVENGHALGISQPSTSQLSLKALPQGAESSSARSQLGIDVLRPGLQRGDTNASRNDSSCGIQQDDSGASDLEHDVQEHAPGTTSYRRVHQRTLSTTSKQSAAERLNKITASLDFANNSKVKGEITAAALEALQQAGKDRNVRPASLLSALANGGEDGDDLLGFAPYIFHKPHAPVPIAMVNRRPHGTPGHSDIRNPQDAAWLAGFRYAQKHVFIQSPTLNASPIKAAVLACVKRHVRVELWLDLGFNDKSESMPFQGGTNEQVVTALYRQLRKEGKGNEKFLEVYWYTGKDMTRPLNAVRKQRNCHVKFAAYDGQVGIIGSGNQDTQSWFHSQECNVMVDSAQIVSEWMDALRRCQSTHIYGKVDQRDGIWRGATGREVADTGKES